MSSRRVQNLSVNSDAASPEGAESKCLHTTVYSSHQIGNTISRENTEAEEVSFACPPALARYVSDEIQDYNSALQNLPSRRPISLAHYVCDETEHYYDALQGKRHNNFVHIPNKNINCTEYISHVDSIPQDIQHTNTENIVGCIISSERINMFVKEARIQSHYETTLQLQRSTAEDDQDLISFLPLQAQHMEMSSNISNQPAYSCLMTKTPCETNSLKSTGVIGNAHMVPDSPASNSSNSYNSKLINTSRPIRPLNAYNYFFTDERERILSGNDNDVYDDDKKQRLLLQHLMKDRSARRKHRKTHGKINFTTLSRMISQRWKSLPEEKKQFYKDICAADWARYRRETSERIEQKQLRSQL